MVTLHIYRGSGFYFSFFSHFSGLALQMVMSNITIISTISVSALSSSGVDQPILSCVYIASDFQRHGDQKPLKLTDIFRFQATTGEITAGNGKWAGPGKNFSELLDERLKGLPTDTLIDT